MAGKHKKIFSKLTAMANPKERTSEEHLKLYAGYVDIVR